MGTGRLSESDPWAVARQMWHGIAMMLEAGKDFRGAESAYREVLNLLDQTEEGASTLGPDKKASEAHCRPHIAQCLEMTDG